MNAMKKLAQKVQKNDTLHSELKDLILTFLKTGKVRLFFTSDELGVDIPKGKAVEVEVRLISLSKLNNTAE